MAEFGFIPDADEERLTAAADWFETHGYYYYLHPFHLTHFFLYLFHYLHHYYYYQIL